MASIQLDRDKNLNDFKNKETNLKNKEKKIINQKNILSKEDFDAKLIQLNKELTEYNKNKKKEILDFENSKKIKIENYFNKISPYIQDYVKKKSIGIVINKQNIFIASKDFDITSDIIKLIDLNFKE